MCSWFLEIRSGLVSCSVSILVILLAIACSSTPDPEPAKTAAAESKSATPPATDLESAKRAYERQDYLTAAKTYTALAEQGNEEAQLALAKMFMMGEGVQADREEALRRFKTLAARGNADAQFFVGSMYLLPRRDVGEGVKWLRLSAAQGMQDAQYLLGKTYMQGDKAIPQDRIQGTMWLRLAAKDNHEFYQNELTAAERQLSADEIGKSKALADAWKPVSRAAATPGD